MKSVSKPGSAVSQTHPSIPRHVLRRGGVVNYRDNGLRDTGGIRIPMFNKGGKNNVMNMQESNSWHRQMKAYLHAGEITPEQAKETLNSRYLRLTKQNLNHLTDVLKGW